MSYFRYIRVVFTSSCLQECSCLIYVMFGSSLSPVVCRRVQVLFTLCSGRLYLQLFVGGLMSYLRYVRVVFTSSCLQEGSCPIYVMFWSSLSPVVCRRVQVLFTLCSRLYLQLFVGGLMSYLRYVLVVFTSSCLQDASCLIYVMLASSLSPVVCRRALVLFTLCSLRLYLQLFVGGLLSYLRYVRIFFISSCLQEGSCLIYVMFGSSLPPVVCRSALVLFMLCSLRLYLQLFVGRLMSYLRYVRVVFISSCLQDGSCLIYVMFTSSLSPVVCTTAHVLFTLCSFRLFLQLFVGGPMSYFRYVRVVFTSSCLQECSCLIYVMFGSSLSPVVCRRSHVLFTLCSGRLYLQLFVGGFKSYLRYVRVVFISSCLQEGSCLIYVMFGSSLPPVACRRAHVLFTLCSGRLYLQLFVGGFKSYLRYVWVVFISNCLQEGSCLIYVMFGSSLPPVVCRMPLVLFTLCSLRLYLQLFVGGLLSYLRYVHFVFISSCFQAGSCLIYVMFGSSLPPVVCRRALVLFTLCSGRLYLQLFVGALLSYLRYVHFVFISSCLQEGSCLIYVMFGSSLSPVVCRTSLVLFTLCSLRLYLQLFVGRLMSYLRYVHFVFFSSCLQEVSCLIFVMFGSSLPPVVCRRALVLFSLCSLRLYLQLFVGGLISYLRYVRFVFISSCLQQGSCLIYVMFALSLSPVVCRSALVLFTLCSGRLYLQLFVGRCCLIYVMFGSSLPPVICRTAVVLFTLCSGRLYLQLFVGGPLPYLRYVRFVFISSCLQEGSCLIYVMFGSSLPPVVCRRALVLFTLCSGRLYLQLFVVALLSYLRYVHFVFISSCLQEGSCLIYVMFTSSLSPVVCRSAHVLFSLCSSRLYLQLFVGVLLSYLRYVRFVFISSCLQDGSCLIYVMFTSSLSPVVCRSAHVLFSLCSSRLYLQLFVGVLLTYLRYVRFVFISSCLQEASCLIYVMFGSSLPPVVCRRALALFTVCSLRLYLQLFVGGLLPYLLYVRFVFISSCVQEGSCLIYVMFGSSLPPVVCRRALALFTLCSLRLYLQLCVGGLLSYLRYVLVVFISSCLQEGSCLIYVMFGSSLPPVVCRRAHILFTLCSLLLYLQLFVGGLLSYLRYVRFVFISSCLQEGSCLINAMFGSSLHPVVCRTALVLFTLCSLRLYLQLFVGGLLSYLRYVRFVFISSCLQAGSCLIYVMFTSSLSPVVCRKAHVLFTLCSGRLYLQLFVGRLLSYLRYVHFVFISSCLQDGSCLIYVMFTSSLSPVVCRRAHVLFSLYSSRLYLQLFVGVLLSYLRYVRVVFISSCLQEGSSLIYVMFGSSLTPVVCRRAHVLFTLCSGRLYLQLFVGGLMSYLRYVLVVFISSCLQEGSSLIYVMFGSSLSPIVCRRAHVLFTLCSGRLYLQLFVGRLLSYLRYARFVFISSCLQEGSCLIYVMFTSSLSPVVCRRTLVLFTLCSDLLYLQLFVGGLLSYLRYVRVVFTSSCLQERSCLIYVMFTSSLSPVVCRKAHVLFTLCSGRLYLQLFVGRLLSYLRYVHFVFISSCLYDGSCLIYVMFISSFSPVVCRRAHVLFSLCSGRLYLQLFVGVLLSYLRYVRVVFISSCLQEVSCLIYVMFGSSLSPVVCRRVQVLFTLCSGRLYLQLFVGGLMSYLRYVRVVFTSSCLQEGSCLIYVMFWSSLSPVVCRRVQVLFTLCSGRLYLQLFVGGLMSYLRYVRVVFTSSCLQDASCLIYVMLASSLSPVVCRRALFLFTLCSLRLYLQLFLGGLLSYLRYVRVVFTSSCLQEGSCLIYVMFGSSLPPVVCRSALVLFTLCSLRLYLQLFVGRLMSYLRYVRVVFISSCLQDGSCLIYVKFTSSLSPVVCRTAHVLFTLCSGRLYLQLFVGGLLSYLRYVRFVFISSCLQEGSYLIYVMFASSLSPVVCSRALVLFTLCSLCRYLQLFVGVLQSYLRYVRVVFTSSYLQDAVVLFTLCSGRLYLQLFVVALLSYLRYVHFVFISSCLQECSCLIFVMFESSLPPVVCRSALVLFTLCSLRFYLQLFVGSLLSYLRYVRVVFTSSCLQEGSCLIYCMFASSLSPVVCRRALVLFTLCSGRLYLQLFVGGPLPYLRYVRFVFISSCLQEGSCLIYVMFWSSLPPVVCRRALVLFTLCSGRLYLQLFVGRLLSYLRYVHFVFISSCLQECSCLIFVMFESSLPPVVCRSALVLFTLCSLRFYLQLFVGSLLSYLRYVRVVFTSSCLQEGSCLIYCMFASSLSPVVCRRALVLFTLCSGRLYLQLFVGGLLPYLRYVRFVFISSCVQEGSCLIYVMFWLSLSPVVCRRAHVLFTLCSGRLYLQLFVGGLISYLRYVRFFFISSCLQEGSCLIYAMFGSSLHPVVCRTALALFTLCSLRLYLQLFVGGLLSYLRYVRFVFISSCLQAGSCLIYIMFGSSLPSVVCRRALVLFMLCSGRLYLQLFVGGLLSYLRYVHFVFISSCLQEGSCLIYVMFGSSLSPVVCRTALVLFTLCSLRLYLQLFVGRLMSDLRYVHFVFISSCLQEGSCLIFVIFESSLPPVVCRSALVLFTLCSGRLYLQLFVGGLKSYLRYVRVVFISSCLQEGSCLIYVMFGSSLPPAVCRRAHVLFTLCSGRLYLQLFVGGFKSYLRYVRVVFISNCLQEGSFLIYVMFWSSLPPVVCRTPLVLFTLCSLRLYLQLFVGGLLSYLRYVHFVFISSCLQADSCLIYVMFGSSLSPVVCRRALVLFTLCSGRLYLQLFVGALLSYLRYVHFVFISSCLQEGSCLIYVMFGSSLSPVVCRTALVLFTLCSLRLYLQLFVGRLMSYLRYVHFVFFSSCLQEGPCLIFVMFGSSLPTVVCRSALVLFTLCSGRLYLQLFVGGLMSYLRYVRVVFISSCLQEGSSLIYVMFGSSLSPVVCRTANVLFTLCSGRLYLQLFVGGLMSYLRYVLVVFISSCLQEGSSLIYVMFGSSLSPIVCRRAHVLFTLCSGRLYLQLFVGCLLSYLRYARFVFISSCLQEGSCLIYVMFTSSLSPVVFRRALVLFTLCSGRLYLQLFVGGLLSYLRYVRVVFTSSCLQERSCLIYVMFTSSLSPVVCRKAHVLFTLCSGRLYLQLFVGRLLSYLRYVHFVFISSCLQDGSCLIYVMFISSFSPVVCRRAHVLFSLCSGRLYLQLFVGGLLSYLRYVRFVFISSCLQEGSYLIYVMFASSLSPVVCSRALVLFTLCSLCRYLQMFVGVLQSYLRYVRVVFSSSYLQDAVVLFTLCSGRLYLQLFVGRLLSYLRYVRVVFISSCLQEGPCLIYVMFASSLSPVVCRRALVLFTLCSGRLYLQLFVGGRLSYLRYVRVVFTSSCLQQRSCLIYVMFTSSLSPVVCRKAHVLFTLCSCRLYLQLFVGRLMSYLRYVHFVFISSCLQDGSCLNYVMFTSSLSPVVCRRALVLFTLYSLRLYLQLFVGGLLSYLRYVRVVFTSSCLQDGSCLIYVMFTSSLSPVVCRSAHVLFTLCSLRLYLQLFVGGHLSYLRYVRVVFISSCLQEGSCLIYVTFGSSLPPVVYRRFTLCSLRLYLQLFVGGLLSYLRYIRVVFTSSYLQDGSCLIYVMFGSSLSPVVCRRAFVLIYVMFASSLSPVVCRTALVLFTLCSLFLYLKLFVGRLLSYLRYVRVFFTSSCLQERSCLIYVMFTSSLSPVVCRRALVLFTLCSLRLYLQLFVGGLLSYLRYVHFVFISSCLQADSCLIYVMFGSSLSPVVCRRALVLFTLCSGRLYLQLFVGALLSYLRYVHFVFISSCLQEGSCLIYVMFGSSLSPVVCRTALVLFTLCSLRLYLQMFVGRLMSYLRYVHFVFFSSCLQEGPCLIFVMFGSSLPPVVCRSALVLFTLCSGRLYPQLFVGGLMSYLRYVRVVFISSCLQEGSSLIYVMFGSSLSPVVCRRANVLFTLCSGRLYLQLFVGGLMSYLRYVLVVFISSCLQEGSSLIYVMFGSSLSPIVCRRAHVLFTLCSGRLYLQLFVGCLLFYLRYARFVFISSCLQEGSCLIYVMFTSSLSPVVFRRALVLFTLCSGRLYLQLFVGGLLSYLRYVRVVFTSSCLQERSCLIYVMFTSSLSPVVCRKAHVLFTLCSGRLYLQLFVGRLLSYLLYVHFVFISSCLQDGSCLIYVMFISSFSPVVCRRAHVLFSLCSGRLYLQLFVGGLLSYLRYVRFVFISSCLQEGSYLIYVMFASSLSPVVCRRALALFTLCSLRLYLQLFVGGLLSYLRYVRVAFTSSCLQEGACLIYVMFGSSLPPVVCSSALVLFTLCSLRLYLQLFVGGRLSYLRYVRVVFTSSCLQEGSCLIFVMFGSSLPPVICRTLLSYLRYVQVVFTSSYLQDGCCLIYVMFGSSLSPVVCRRALALFTLCSLRLYLQLFVGGLLSYLRYVRVVFTSSCLQEGACLIYVMFGSSLPPVVCSSALVLFTLCSLRLYLQLFVGRLMSYLRYVRVIFISSCLQDGSCLIYVMFTSSLFPVVCRTALVLITLCSLRLYLQLFVGGLLSYLRYIRFVFISSCLQEGSCLIYVMFGSSLPPVVCRTALVLFTLCSLRLYLQLFVGVLMSYLRYVRFVFISSCLQEGTCLIYVMFGSSLSPVVCRRALVLFTLCSGRLYLQLFIGGLLSYLRYVHFVFISSCLQEGSCLIYVMLASSLSPVVCRRALVLFTLCSLRLYLQLFVGGLLSYLRYVRIFFISSCLQEGSCLIYVMFGSSLPPVVCRSALVLFTLCSLRLYLQLFVGRLMSYLRYVRVVFISSCLQDGSCLIYVMFTSSLSPDVCRTAHVLFTLCSFRLFLQLFVGGPMSYFRYVRVVFTSSCLQECSCLIYVMFGSSLSPVVCRRSHVLFTLCSGRLYLQLFVGGFKSYLRYVRVVFISSCLQEG